MTDEQKVKVIHGQWLGRDWADAASRLPPAPQEPAGVDSNSEIYGLKPVFMSDEYRRSLAEKGLEVEGFLASSSSAPKLDVTRVVQFSTLWPLPCREYIAAALESLAAKDEKYRGYRDAACKEYARYESVIAEKDQEIERLKSDIAKISSAAYELDGLRQAAESKLAALKSVRVQWFENF